MYLDAQRAEAGLTLRLNGDWLNARLPEIQAEFQQQHPADGVVVSVDAAAAHFDISGAWLLLDFLNACTARGCQVRYLGEPPAFFQLIEHAKSEPPLHALPVRERADWLHATAAVESVGRRTIRAAGSILSSLEFVGRVCVTAGGALRHWRQLRPTSIARHVFDTGVSAIPIVSLIAFLISVILAYIGAQQLRSFGADIFVVDLVTIGLLRELGVLLTAIIVAGRSGSAFAAEIGAMRLNQEVDALDAAGVNPIEVLVLPRLLGLMIALPLLAVIADIVGLVGGGILCRLLLDMPVLQYVNRAQDSIGSTTFWVGLWKAPVFAILIAMSGARCGFRVRGSTRELGRLTTLAVVQAIFFVILADALFAVLFLKLGI
jgi:phospholipid/cholesterol/gamma-HCH transport system permease protein